MSEKGETKLRLFKFRVFAGRNGTDEKIARKMRELGINPQKVSDEILKKTTKYKGFRVNVLIAVEGEKFVVNVDTTYVTLLVDAIREQKHEGDAAESKKRFATASGNITLEKFKEISKKTQEIKKDRDLIKTAIFIVGVAETMGIKIDGKPPNSIIEKLKSKEIIIE